MTGFVFKIQANMDPNHRDRIAFMRVCSGRLTRGMKAKLVRTGKPISLSAPQFFFARDRAIADEAFAGDVVGIPNHGTLRIGDTLTEGEDILFRGVPSFAPEILRRIKLTDAMKAKKLREALQQMGEEGVVQVFLPHDGSPAIVGVVGALQLDVLKERLLAEYGLPIDYDTTRFSLCRWVSAEDRAELDRFIAAHGSAIAADLDGAPVFMAASPFSLKYDEERCAGDPVRRREGLSAARHLSRRERSSRAGRRAGRPGERSRPHQPRVLDADAAVHHHGDAGGLGAGAGGVVADAELHPQRRRVCRNRLVDRVPDGVRPAEDVDEIDRLRDVLEARMEALAVDGLAGRRRVHGDDAVAGAPEIAHHAEARPPRLGARTDHRDRPRPAEDAAEISRAVGVMVDRGGGWHEGTKRPARTRFRPQGWHAGAPSPMRARRVPTFVMITFATLCAAYILSQFYRSFLAIVAPDLTRELGLGPAELGALSAAWFGAFALAQFPIGWALDRLGPRRTLGGAMLGAVAGALLFAAANGFSAMMAAMALIGIGCAPVLMASMFVFGRAYPAERFALLSSLVLGIGALGVLAAATPLAYAVEAFGWRASIAAIGVLTAAATLAVFLLIKDPPLAPRAAHIEASAWRDLVSIMTLKALWPLLPLTFVAYAVVAAERSLWIGPYLLEVHALDAIARGNAILAMSVAMSIGAIAYGPAERLLRSAKLTVLIGSVVAGAAFVALGVAPALSTAAVVVLLSIIGSFGMTYGILMTHARAFFPEHLLGRGITFMNFIFIAGAGLIQAVSGLFVKASAASGTPPVDGFARLHLAFGVLLLAATAIYVAAPAKPFRAPA